MIDEMRLISFVEESNMIEGIFRHPYQSEIQAHIDLLDVPAGELGVNHIEAFVRAVQSDAHLRSRAGMNVAVGNHIPPSGGMGVVYHLNEILADSEVSNNPFEIHARYEKIHPFTDGNGRSGRALWLRMMQRIHGQRGGLKMSFLQQWYYQSLDYMS